MFSLIITIISIALVAALALATLYYGKDFVGNGSARALAARAIQEGNQVRGAIELYRTEHNGLPTGTSDEIVAALTTDAKYLREWPDTVWAPSNDFLIRSDVTEQACVEINKRLGMPVDPAEFYSCNDPRMNSSAGCCTAD